MTKTLQLNEASGVPLWQQIADAIVSDIADKTLAIGDTVPTYREIASSWNVSPQTAMNALTHLRRQGLISRARGRQSSKVLRSPAIARMTSGRYRHGEDHSPVAADLDRADHSFTVRGVATVEAASARVARRLNISPGDEVSRIDYFFHDEIGPYERSTQWEPLAITRGTSAETPPENGEPNVITRMAKIGHHVDAVREEWTARMPTAAESDELELEEGRPVMVCERHHYAGETPVETADISIRSDRTIVAVDHQVGNA